MEQTEGPHNMNHLPILAVLISAALLAPGRSPAAEEKPADAASHPLHYIDSTIENGSPLWWEIEPDGAVRVHLVYDQERASPNRANGHWLFRIDAAPDADLTLVLGPFGDIWNGKPAGPVPEAKIAFVSDDGQCWRPIPVEPAEPYHLKLRVHTAGPSLYVARAAPYRLSDLEKFKAEIGRNPLVEVAVIGRTVEGRELEMIRVGRPDAPRRLLLRARAHGWEPGGNWVVEGLVRRLLRDDETARRCLDRYCVYVMPMANKDGVARGRTRFNLRGMDLNRKWDRPADPSLAPENAALEKWLEAMIARGRRPDLAIDFHGQAARVASGPRPAAGRALPRPDAATRKAASRAHVVHRGQHRRRFPQPGLARRGAAGPLRRPGVHPRTQRQLDRRPRRPPVVRPLEALRRAARRGLPAVFRDGLTRTIHGIRGFTAGPLEQKPPRGYN